LRPEERGEGECEDNGERGEEQELGGGFDDMDGVMSIVRLANLGGRDAFEGEVLADEEVTRNNKERRCWCAAW